METSKCVACPEGTEFDAEKRSCTERHNYISNILTSQPWISENGDTTAVLQDFADKAESGDYDFCPKETPFVVDGECVKCDFDQIYHV